MKMPRRSLLYVSAAFVVSVITLLIMALPSKAVQNLPNELSDKAFWSLITDFSEEGGYFRFDNFLSNELALQSVIPELKRKTRPGGVYIGVGPEQNFT